MSGYIYQPDFRLKRSEPKGILSRSALSYAPVVLLLGHPTRISPLIRHSAGLDVENIKNLVSMLSRAGLNDRPDWSAVNYHYTNQYRILCDGCPAALATMVPFG